MTQLCREHSLSQHLLELPCQAYLAKDRFGVFVLDLGQQLGRVHTSLKIWHAFEMEITEDQYRLIEDCMPLQRGNVSLSNLQVLNAILYVTEQGCKWRGLPERFGRWHTVYTRMNRWSKAGVLDRVFERLQHAQIVHFKIDAVSLDSTSIKVHPDGTGALKKTVRRP